MKVFEIRDAWGIANLRPGKRPEPAPGPGQVLLAMRAASLNARDRVVPERGYGRSTGTLPLIPVSDGVGEVIGLGEGVEGLAPGTRVCPLFFQGWIDGPATAAHLARPLGGPLDGVMAERMVLPAEGVVPVPDHLSDVEAATLPCAALTAWSALVTQGALAPGQSVLIQGSGGVALFALAFAQMLGARTVVLTSSPAKAERLTAMGADAVIDYRAVPEWGRPAREVAGGEGFDHVLELGGEATLAQSLRCVRPGGTISLIGVLSGLAMNASLGPVVTRAIRLQGITVGSRAGMLSMMQAIGQHRMHPVVDRVYAFDELREGLDALRHGGHVGKICLSF